jgi:hypothetical protein
VAVSALALVAALGSAPHPFHVAPVAGPLESLDLVECPRLIVTLPAARCVDRHVARWPSGRRKGTPKWPTCAACPLGAAYRARLSGYVPPRDSQPAEVMDNAQRAAKMRWAITHLEPEMEERDPLREAALMTPDDRGVATAGA